MKATLRYYIYLLLSLAAIACAKELDNDINIQQPSDKSMVEVDLEASFYPCYTATLDTKSNGDALNEIENIFVGFYDVDEGNLLYSYYFDNTTDPKLDIENTDNTDYYNYNPSETAIDEDPICKGTVSKVNIPLGTYHVVAVANMGNLQTRPDDVATLDKISAISLSWDDDPSKNNEMSGFFTNESRANPPHTGDKPPTVTVEGNTHKLHAWLRRAASKVTVSFDATQLNQNTFIYIKSIKLKDIPKSCPLINQNTPKVKFNYVSDGDTYSITNESESDLKENGEAIEFEPSSYENFKSWPVITRGSNEYLSNYMGGKDPHAPNSKASLFFYENMQGVGKSKHQVDPNAVDKYRPTYPNGYIPTDPNWKDEKYCGSYVEVEGFYEAYAGGNHTKGKIIYRFMLGKDVDTDYNAERNYHYKLTLVFKGNANDVDWHIEYKEDTQYWAPSPYYISYLYKQKMYLPIQTQGDVARIEAQIITNEWFPRGETADEQDALIKKNGTASPYNIYWAGNYVKDICTHQGDLVEGESFACHVGFLSLRDEQVRTIEETGNEFNQYATVDKAFSGVKYLDDLWHNNKLGFRVYYNPLIESQRNNFLATSKPDQYYGVYNVEDESMNSLDKRHVFNIPLYTRPLNLVTVTGYTGNNPYFNYIRKAVIRIKAYNSSGDLVTGYNPQTGQNEDHVDVEIIQVRRIINPKGIFRHASNDEKFHIVLHERHGDINTEGGTTTYEPVVSHGTWTARIIAGEEWVRIGKNDGEWGSQTISGDTETNIDFWYKPVGTIPIDQTRSGLIEVSYNNNTCVHTIVVKQGYAPVQLIANRPGSGTPYAKWSNFNMRSATVMCKSPLEEGSYFRAGKKQYPIHPNNFWGQSVKYNASTFNLYPSGTETWANIGKTGPTTSTELFSGWSYSDNIYGATNTYYPARLQDYAYLRNQKNDHAVAPDIDVTYGIVYGDGATECQTDLVMAHEYRYDMVDNYSAAEAGTDYPRSKRGMRGCIAYNNGYYNSAYAGNCVFWPSGATGYGYIHDYSSSTKGMMIYGANAQLGDVSGSYTNVMSYRPILHRLDLNFGMAYWVRYDESGYAANDSWNTAWDFNMSTFDFNFLGTNSNAHACMVRMVVPGTGYKKLAAKLFDDY